MPTLESPDDALVKMMMHAPMQPRATPPAFLTVMGSCSIRNDSIMAKIGVDVAMMLALDGEVMLSPMVNEH